MLFKNTLRTESILFDDYNNTSHSITFVQGSSINFLHIISSLDENWLLALKLGDTADYERVKYNVMEIMFECEDTGELLELIHERIEDGFADLIAES